MRPVPLLAIALLAAACESSPPARSAALAPPAAPAPTLSEQAKSLAVATRPGAMHSALSPLVGAWDVTVADVSAGGSEGETFHGEAALAWLLGGRFLRWEATVDFGGAAGTTTGYLGYDPRAAQYQLVMISDLANGMGVAHGSGTLASAGIVFALEQVDPMSGAARRARSRLRLVTDDHFTLEQLGEGERTARVWHYRRKVAPTR